MQKRKAIIALLVILAMVLAIMPFKVFAEPAQADLPNLVEIKLRKATNVTINNGEATITYENGTALVTAQGINYAVKHDQQVGMQDGNPIYGDMYYLYTIDTTVTFNLMPNNNYETQRWENGQPQDVTNNTYTMTNLQVGQGKDQEVEFTFEYAGEGGGGEGEEELPGGNSNAIIRVMGGTGSYTDRRYNPDTDTQEEIQVPYAESYINARFNINGGRIQDIPYFGEDEPIPLSSEVNVNYNGEEGDTTVTIGFRSLFLWKYVGKITVNGTDYDIPMNYEDREDWISHYNHQEVGFEIEVSKATDNIYNTAIKLEPVEQVFIGNFLWTSNPEEEYLQTPDGGQQLNDDYIAHSKIEFVKVKYQRNGSTITKKISDLNDLGEQEQGPGQYWHNYNSGDGSIEFGSLTKVNNTPVNYDEGSMVLVDGSEVTLKITPEYGYQVTAFTINGDDVITGDNISEFTFKVRGGNAHIGARVTKVDDDVKSSTAAVTGGEIILGENELDAGTARLSVSDANISEDKVEKFEEEAGNEYEINSILDINLNQVFFKGEGSDNVWTGDKLEDLNSTATVGLALKDKIDPENSVIIHNIHNGTEYETIDIRGYDPETNAIYFPVDSFSSYAIATKTSTAESATDEEIDSKKADGVKTGDTIMIFVGTFLVATLALVMTKRRNKYKIISRH